MNDRYLFRAKRIDNGEWVEGFYCKWRKGKRVITYSEKEVDCIITWMSNGGMQRFEVDQSTICQCTGLKGKNGKLIWENDVVKCNYNNYGEKGAYVGKVIFREDNCIFVVTNGKSTDYEWWNEEKEVIGNIFDNADLLGE